MNIVRANRLGKSFGNRRVVNGVSFDIRRGSCFGLLGPNGAGKTTILRMILGLSPVSDGELYLFDKPVKQAAREIRTRTGVVPQLDNLDPDFTVSENLSVYASYFGIDAGSMQSRNAGLLEFVNLCDRANARIDTLSGGMQRRLTIARALVNDPELVVLDEPTTGLDPQARHLIWQRLRDLVSMGKTLLLTTHYMEEAERLCDELAIMEEGVIITRGSPASLISQHVPPEVVEIRNRFDEVKPLLGGFPQLQSEQVGDTLYLYGDDMREVLAKIEARAGISYVHRPANLEDVFLKLTGRELRD